MATASTSKSNINKPKGKKPLSARQIALISIAGTLIISSLVGIAISELIISRLYPQNTYKIALTGVLSVFKPGKNTPFELQVKGKSHHIAPTHEFANDITTNNQGYRGADISLKKPDNTTRILMLGDSTTFGVGSNDDQTFSVVLENLLNQETNNRFEVINAGFASGLSPDTYYLYLKEKGLKLEPDIVFVNLFLANDITDLFENQWPKIDSNNLPEKIVSKERQIDRQGRLVFRQKDWKYRLPLIRNMHVGILSLNLIEEKFPRLETMVRFLVNAPDLLEDIPEEEKINCLYHNQCSDRFQQKWTQLERIFSGFQKLSETKNIPIIITLMPAPFQLTAHREGIENDYKIDVVVNQEKQVNQNYPQKRIINYLNSINLAYFDLLPAMRNGENPEYSNEYIYPQDQHFTPKGNLKIAQAYFEYIKSHFSLTP